MEALWHQGEDIRFPLYPDGYGSSLILALYCTGLGAEASLGWLSAAIFLSAGIRTGAGMSSAHGYYELRFRFGQISREEMGCDPFLKLMELETVWAKSLGSNTQVWCSSCSVS